MVYYKNILLRSIIPESKLTWRKKKDKHLVYNLIYLWGVENVNNIVRCIY